VYIEKKDKKPVGEDMDALVEKIKDFLAKNPNSKARTICKEIGAEKKAVNSCLYANLGSFFLKEGVSPPLWRNFVKASPIGSSLMRTVYSDS